MALFAIGGKSEATSRDWAPELDIKKSESGPFRFDGHKTHWRSGAFCHIARKAYEPRIWPLELDNRKAQATN